MTNTKVHKLTKAINRNLVNKDLERKKVHTINSNQRVMHQWKKKERMTAVSNVAHRTMKLKARRIKYRINHGRRMR